MRTDESAYRDGAVREAADAVSGDTRLDFPRKAEIGAAGGLTEPGASTAQVDGVRCTFTADRGNLPFMARTGLSLARATAQA
jgi:hypothetical protein